MTTDPSRVSEAVSPPIAESDEPAAPAGAATPAPAPPSPDSAPQPADESPAEQGSASGQTLEPPAEAPAESPAGPTAEAPAKRQAPPAGGPLANALERLKAQAALRPQSSESQPGRPLHRTVPPKPEGARPEAERAESNRGESNRVESNRVESNRGESNRGGPARGESGRTGADRPKGGRRPSGPRPGAERHRGEQPSIPSDAGAPGGRVPPPSRRDRLPPELELELEAAFSETSLDDLVTDAAPRGAGDLLEIESRHRAEVVKIHGDNVFFSLGGRNEGVASLRQFPEPPPIGTLAEVVVRGYHAEDGLYEVTVPGGSVDVHDWSDLMEGTVVEARVTGSNVGGLECTVGSIRGFIPASQIEMHRVEQLSDYYEKKLRCVVTEANERRRNLVLSHRAVLEREREESRKKLMEELEVGQVRDGVVTSVRDFGAFVDLGGVEGLVHISQLSWDRVNHPSEVLQSGQKVRVKVEKINLETGKIGLSYRDLLEHPWTSADAQFPLNSTVKGVVTRIAKFGAFVKIAPGIEGLIHVSELAHHRVVQVNSVVQEGEEVEVKVLSLDKENQRIGLSLKAAHPLPGEEAAAEAEEEDTPRPEPVVKPRLGPLRGGRESSSGGEQFGLKW